MFKTKCIICWLAHISFTQGEVYSGLEIKTAEAKFDPRVIARGSISVPPQPHVLSNGKAYFWGSFAVFKISLYSDFIGSAQQVLKTKSGMCHSLYRWEAETQKKPFLESHARKGKGMSALKASDFPSWSLDILRQFSTVSAHEPCGSHKAELES